MAHEGQQGIGRRSFLKGVVQASVAASLGAKALPLAAEKSGRPVEPPSPSLQLNVRDFGATGDGSTLETASLQQALDRCNVLGGGEVLIPAGRYLTGGLSLRCRVTLRLDKDAVLLGSADLAHYPVAQVRWEGKWIPGYTALVHALDARDIGIVGEGKIEGNEAVAGRPTKDNPLRRPALIEFINCDGVHLEGI